MKRALFAVLLIAVLALVGRALWFALAGDDTRIRWLLADEVAAFNDASALRSLRGFAEDYREETIGLDKLSLRRALLYLFTRDGDRPTDRFAYRVEMPDEDLSVEVEPAGNRATARFRLLLFQGLNDRKPPTWELRVTAELAQGDGGWLIVRSRHETTSGEPPR
jgi:hypothetical protein